MKRSIELLIAGALYAAGGCGGGGSDASGAGGGGGSGSGPAALPEGCTVLLRGGTDDRDAVQTALIEAAENSTVCLEGTFEITTDHLSLSDKKGLTIKGVGTGTGPGAGAVLDFKDKVGPTGLKLANMTGITLLNFTVKNTLGDAIEVRGSTGVTIREMRVTWERGSSSMNGAYGFYPVESNNVLVEDSEASYSADAGIYIGQSENIILRHNVAFGNVSGMQVENSKNAEVYENEARDNALGVLTHDLPGSAKGNGGWVRIHDNKIHDNNTDNFALMGISKIVPPGTGIMVMAIDHVEVDHNQVENNKSAGTVVLSFTTAELLGGAPDKDDPSYDPYPETTFIHDNTYTSNGTAPDGGFKALGFMTLEDILWDGTIDPLKDNTDGSLSLCIKGNGAATFRDLDVSGGFMNQTTDLASHDCSHPPNPPVQL
jgi:parallel beta-helix repeat protein